MFQNITVYINEVFEKYKTGRAGEHAYRPTFEKLIRSLDEKLEIINDPKRTEHGAPDFVFVRGDLIAGYVETKDINADLDKVEKTEQIERYLGYSNLILTNYIEFRFFKNGERYGEPIVIGKVENDTICIQEEFIDSFGKAIINFLAAKPEAIKSGVRLAKIMGGKARRIRDNVQHYLAEQSKDNKELERIYETIKQLLVHDLTREAFADMYAQTLVYGLFVARYYDDTPDTFTRQEARDLIPASNPFLQHFFDHIVGADFDQRLAYIVNELCEVFSLADVQQLMKQYFQDDLWGKEHAGPDPVIHFYEDFLKEYDSDLRKRMGAFYTPLPIVRFIVRSIDYLLKKQFSLIQGLADTAKIGPVHRVQILDPAVGTGTFISEVIRTIHQSFSGQEGRWPTYVLHDLLPRLYGFELMMAPYTIAHLKLSMMLKQTGFKYFNNRRFGIYLTNSLEQSAPQKDLFSFGLMQSIAEEAKEASVVKNQMPIMVVMGNPPYSVSSSNVNEYTQRLIEEYKKGLLIRNTQPLSDDYIKFIRLGETLIQKNKVGILAYISNRSFLEGIVHKSMRASLLKSFDDIYIIDLNGDATINQGMRDSGNDENVFDIKQGVAISIFIKNVDKAKEQHLRYFSLRGSRLKKFEFLDEHNLQDIKFEELKHTSEYNFFVKKNLVDTLYEKFISIGEIFRVSSSAIATSNDDELISFEKDNIFSIPLSYRPFDERYINYDLKKVKGNRYNKLVKYLLNKELDRLYENINLCCSKNVTTETFSSVLVSRSLVERKFCDYSRGPHVFPLYIYDKDGSRISNLKKEIVDEIEKIVGKVFPEDIFDYIYAILYSPSYREKYKEFLKIDFPRIPYPLNKESFEELVKLGSKLRSLHLFESLEVNQFITTYTTGGSNTVERVIYKDGNVLINENQYFGNVPEVAWSFSIGGYQPAEKWLKDRKGRTLTNYDIEYYQKIIVTLKETDRIMKEIDKS